MKYVMFVVGDPDHPSSFVVVGVLALSDKVALGFHVASDGDRERSVHLFRARLERAAANRPETAR